MNKYFHILLLVICIITDADGQFLYTKQGSKCNSFINIYEESVTNNLLITCANYTTNVGANFSDSKVSILKINPSGTMIDSFNIGNIFITAGKMIFNQGNYYIYGWSANSTVLNNRMVYPSILKYDNNFNEIKRTILDSVFVNSVSSIQNSVIINNNIYVVYYYGMTPIAKLFKLSLDLTIINSISFAADEIHSMIKQDDKLLISGSGMANGSSFGRAQTIKIDTNFNVINNFNFDSITNSPTNCSTKIGIAPQFANMVEISNSSYYITGFSPVPYSVCTSDDQTVYAIIKNNDEVLKGGYYGSTGGVRESYANFSSTSDKKGKYIFSTSISDFTNGIVIGNFTPTKILTAKIDTSGNLIWQKYFGTSNYYYQPMAVAATSDSGVVVSGMRFNTLFPTQKDSMEGFVIKYDKDGNLSINNTIVKEQTKSFISVELYPNPTSNETSVNISLVNSSDVTVTVLNNVGQIVHQSMVTLNAGSNKLNIDTKNLASGIYNVLVATENGSVTKKLSVTK
ncbi:MAG: T9SS type A sorting domain-containing protein [Bacteroidia bacterium]